LANAVRDLLLDTPRREAMGAQAKARAQMFFSVDAMRDATDDVYRNLLQSGTHSKSS